VYLFADKSGNADYRSEYFTMTDSIHIMIVDDHAQVHRGLSILEDTYSDLIICAHASNGEEAIRLCDEEQPDIIVMDVIMPVMGGIEATRAIHKKYPAIKILALSGFHDDDSVRDMIKAGA